MLAITAGVLTALALVLGIRQIALRSYRAQGWPYLSFRPLKWKVPLEGDKPVLLDEQVEFDARHGHYLRIAEVIITLSAASIAFIPQMHAPTRSSLYAYCLVLLGEAVLLCVLFMVLLTYFYESSLYAPAAYTASRSAWVNGVGFGGLICFGVAYVLLACQVGWAIANGTLTPVMGK
jgi:hypothetical protein